MYFFDVEVYVVIYVEGDDVGVGFVWESGVESFVELECGFCVVE